MEILTLKHKTVQAYIINSNDLCIMVDSGYPESLNLFSKLLTNNNKTFYQIKYLIITHFHPDHAGLVQQLLDYGIHLIIHENQKEYLEWINNHFRKHVHKKYKPINTKNNEKIITLDSNESQKLFKEYKIDCKIIPTPGHTEDSITFIANGIAFIGDLPKYNEKGLYKTTKIQNSWNKILENSIKEIYPGHGEKYSIEM
jgi:glyoxylase-like metal-dependent hydrolase (beta-lactamase superfamily II)